MLQSGVRFIRADSFVHWAQVEKEKGIYDPSVQGDMRREYIVQLAKHGLSPLIILDYGNPHYDPHPHPPQFFPPPISDAGIKAFGQYCYTMVCNYHKWVKYWEIWNEPNVNFWPPHPDPEQYMRLVREASRRIREADPHAYIIAGGASAIGKGFQRAHPDWYSAESWYRKLLQMGLNNYVDAIGIHFYRSVPEAADRIVPRLQNVLREYDATGLQIWDTEDGYSATRGITQHMKAAYLARLYFNDYGLGINKVFWFYMGWDNLKHGRLQYGLFDSQGKPLPAFFAYRSVASILNGCPQNVTNQYHLELEETEIPGGRASPWSAGSAVGEREKADAGKAKGVPTDIAYYLFRTRGRHRKTFLTIWLTGTATPVGRSIRVRARNGTELLVVDRVLDVMSGKWSTLGPRGNRGSLLVKDYPLVYTVAR